MQRRRGRDLRRDGRADEVRAECAGRQRPRSFHVSTLAVLKDFEFEEMLGTTQIRREPVGVCGLITPWNWPINQISCKVAPALAAGCTIVLKPSEIAPLSAHVFAEILAEAGVPKGVFNLVDGDGPTVGEAISRHPDIDMVSFTGSTRAGVLVAKAAADTVKRVSQELGGKSANIILEDADLNAAVKSGVLSMMSNTGQSCNAPSRMLIPAKLYDEAVKIAKSVAEKPVVGDPKADGVTMGPVANKTQFDKIQRLLQKGVEEGATVVIGGPGRPDGLDKGYFVKPTVFANVNNNMTIAREEIFGPVLVMIPYHDEEEAIRIANDTVYGLSGYVYSGNIENARRVARQLRTGMVHLNGAPTDINAPFGGYKQSGNGREWGREGSEGIPRDQGGDGLLERRLNGPARTLDQRTGPPPDRPAAASRSRDRTRAGSSCLSARCRRAIHLVFELTGLRHEPEFLHDARARRAPCARSRTTRRPSRRSNPPARPSGIDTCVREPATTRRDSTADTMSSVAPVLADGERVGDRKHLVQVLLAPLHRGAARGARLTRRAGPGPSTSIGGAPGRIHLLSCRLRHCM